MTRVLLVGYDPETVDFSDPALPPGMTVDKVRSGIEIALKQFAEGDGRSTWALFGQMKPLGRQWSVSWLRRLMIVL
ncbi:MAG TPA: hypothetical protein VLG46_02780 [Anaerolineae bacterium]|nr:hypothetical protein [Anaerolineae bacterium]